MGRPMAYVRYGNSSDWYIFRNHGADAQVEDSLAIWHRRFRSMAPVFSLSEVKKMLQCDDFSVIPGYSESHRLLLRACLGEFLVDARDG